MAGSEYEHPKDEYLLAAKPVGLRRLARKWKKRDPRWSESRVVEMSRREGWPLLRKAKQQEIREKTVSKAITRITDDSAKRARRLYELAQAVQAAGVSRLKQYLDKNVAGKMTEREAVSAIIEGSKLELLVTGVGRSGGVEGSNTLEEILDMVERERAAEQVPQVRLTVNVGDQAPKGRTVDVECSGAEITSMGSQHGEQGAGAV